MKELSDFNANFAMMKSAVVFLSLLTCILFSGNRKSEVASDNPYDRLKCDSVVAYDYDGSGGRQIVKDNKLVMADGQHGRIFGQRILTEKQIKKLHKIISNPRSYGRNIASCFDPHLGIVYYLNKEIVGFISICLDCNYLESSAQIPASLSKKGFMDTEKSIAITLRGFSKSARHNLNEFCKELKFNTCKESLDNDEIFDAYY